MYYFLYKNANDLLFFNNIIHIKVFYFLNSKQGSLSLIML